MKKIIVLWFSVFSMLFASVAYAGTQVLGLEIGVSSYKQVKTLLLKKARIKNEGINKYSGGSSFETDGSPYEIEGLSEVTYIFDDKEVLAAILMTMRKDRFDSVFQALSSKYKVTSQKKPFVGDASAKFKTPDALIEIDAPHLSFVMGVSYIRNDLIKKFNAESATEAATKKKREASQF